ncbi:hypothetical protein B484DRAFT_400294 [Ochromonadaceae sp. CCMP2298]|nr:hypothetical protein B484DRAFT_400294 [Ochromonadaceae sp. CCMP2298]|mmetsp:Transcript_11612/g.25862  ORF Transcript_11612/g.25862 Transcript_11612/m.25862 type:complete len:416 (-) Transcript_11612:495-1742(-)
MVDICGIRLSQIVLADLQILAAAFCFGIGFIGMREISVEGLGPMTANSVRFGLSTVLLMIFKPWVPEDKGEAVDDEDDDYAKAVAQATTGKGDTAHAVLARLFGAEGAQHFSGVRKTVLFWGVFLGMLNFLGSGFQQWGISYTSASKVAFIAGFDIFLVPVFTLLLPTLKHNGKPTPAIWIAVVLSIVGLYLISDASLEDFELGRGETLSIISTFFWTLHIIFTDMATHHIDSLHMMIVQMATVSFLSTTAALIVEPQVWFYNHILLFLPTLVFLAFVEGTAFLLMARGQGFAPPTHAAILLSLEGVFATIAEYLYTGEQLSSYELLGCFLMLLATFIAEAGLCSCAHGTIDEDVPSEKSALMDKCSYLGWFMGNCRCRKTKRSTSGGELTRLSRPPSGIPGITLTPTKTENATQ